MLDFIVVDGTVLVACLHFVGAPGAYVSYLAVLAALLSLYPLTIFPFAGLGVLDAPCPEGHSQSAGWLAQ